MLMSDCKGRSNSLAHPTTENGKEAKKPKVDDKSVEEEGGVVDKHVMITKSGPLAVGYKEFNASILIRLMFNASKSSILLAVGGRRVQDRYV
ncbi:hypothetical protein M8C21_026750 [Ambrosia artemisiifolia]|uniref:Uncharacterized protein n=1 Tax=Ambrosia artemisiifolia TaxID=4212 RepID=A0AAD5GQ51_AMBAR|nr:hypothetical protein M8C21_026750 [Ambrosia artemisiifolia]